MKVGLIGSGFMGKAHAFGFATAERVFSQRLRPMPFLYEARSGL